jgi:hypothetical protein
MAAQDLRAWAGASHELYTLTGYPCVGGEPLAVGFFVLSPSYIWY